MNFITRFRLPSALSILFAFLAFETQAQVTANDDAAYTDMATSVDIDVLSNDNGPLFGQYITGINTPANGSYTLDSVNGIFTYTPNPGFCGYDYFNYLLCATPAMCDTGLVEIYVFCPGSGGLLAVDDHVSVPGPGPLTVTVNVIANDIDTTSSINAVTAGAAQFGNAYQVGGTVVVNYDAPANFCGLDSFDYTICNANGDCASATVYIDVVCSSTGNSAPVAVNDYYIICQGDNIVMGFLGNDYDPDGDPIMMDAFVEYGVAANTVITPLGGAAYTPDSTFVGTDSMYYVISDPSGLSDTGYIYVEVLGWGGCVWPGDTDLDGVANNMDLLPIGLAYGMTGPVRANASIAWDGQSANDWLSTLTVGVDNKHVDTNGDGVINNDDTLAISLNYGMTHFKGAGGGSGAYLGVTFPTDSINAGDQVTIPIVLGDGSTNIDDVYGLAFTLYYDASMVIAGSVSIDFGAGWLGTIGSDMLGMYRERSSMGSVEIALTRTDQTPVDGTGTIAHLSFVMEENLAGKTSGTLEICGGTARAINNLGQTIDVFGGCDSVEVYEVVNGIEPPAKPANIIIYPNPANDYLMVDFAENIVSKVEIINAVGQVVLAKDYDSMPGLASFDVSNLPAGTYILKVNSEGSVNAQNVIIQR